jgi:hypothetical protein
VASSALLSLSNRVVVCLNCGERRGNACGLIDLGPIAEALPPVCPSAPLSESSKKRSPRAIKTDVVHAERD